MYRYKHIVRLTCSITATSERKYDMNLNSTNSILSLFNEYHFGCTCII